MSHFSPFHVDSFAHTGEDKSLVKKNVQKFVSFIG